MQTTSKHITIIRNNITNATENTKKDNTLWIKNKDFQFWIIKRNNTKLIGQIYKGQKLQHHLKHGRQHHVNTWSDNLIQLGRWQSEYSYRKRGKI